MMAVDRRRCRRLRAVALGIPGGFRSFLPGPHPSRESWYVVIPVSVWIKLLTPPRRPGEVPKKQAGAWR